MLPLLFLSSSLLSSSFYFSSLFFSLAILHFVHCILFTLLPVTLLGTRSALTWLHLNGMSRSLSILRPILSFNLFFFSLLLCSDPPIGSAQFLFRFFSSSFHPHKGEKISPGFILFFQCIGDGPSESQVDKCNLLSHKQKDAQVTSQLFYRPFVSFSLLSSFLSRSLSVSFFVTGTYESRERVNDSE